MQYENVHYIVDKIFALYEDDAQAITGARLAEKEGYDDERIVAAFLHDIANRDKLVGRYLQDLGFPCRINDLISGNVKGSFSIQCTKNASNEICAEDILCMKEITTRYLISQFEAPVAYV